MHKVFVYGTLKAGFNNHDRIMKGSVFINYARTAPFFKMYNFGGFPAISREDNNPKPVFGEVWQVTDEVLERMDRLEGHPNWYKRQQEVVRYSPTYYDTVWMYIMPQEQILDRFTYNTVEPINGVLEW